MPGYRSLPEHFSGRVAEGVRQAEVLQRAGANDDAARLLETALELCVATSPEIPGWLCGRLATLYRVLKRYDDEVRLLERYRDSHQHSSDARTRFNARLSKAHAIADRTRRSDSRPLTSVRKPIGRLVTAPPHPVLTDDDDAFTVGARQQLHDAFLAAAAASNGDLLDPALVVLRDETRSHAHPPERMVTTIRRAWQRAAPFTEADPFVWQQIYRDALTRSLAMYFGDADQ